MPVPVNKNLRPWRISERARVRFDKEERPKIHGKVSVRIEFLITRCYLYGFLDKPLESITDAEFLAIGDVGPKTLAAIREVFPAPAS